MTPQQKKNIAALWEIWERKAPDSLMGSLAIEVDHVGPDKVTGKMPITGRVHQLYGMLHGGASVAFAETLCSMAAYVHINADTHYCVGLEINANHVRSAVSGMAFAEARPVHIGRSTQVWSIDIKNEREELLSVCRCTVAVVPKKP